LTYHEIKRKITYCFRVANLSHILTSRCFHNWTLLKVSIQCFQRENELKSSYATATVNSTVSGHRQFRVTFALTFLFFQNVKVFRLIHYPVIFPNLLAAWSLLLVVKYWFTDVVITKRLTALLPWKVKIPVKSLHPTS